MKAHRIVIAEDYTILRQGLRALLESLPQVEVVGEAANGIEAVQLALALRPDLVLLDLSMPGMSGLDAIREIHRRAAEVKLVVLTVHSDQEYISASLQAGASAYVLKDATREELATALTRVLEGRTYLSSEVMDKVVSGFADREQRAAPPASQLETLTEREQQVLKLIAEGHTNKEAAERLYVSVKTIEKHRANLMRKLNLRRAAALTAFAIAKGLIHRH